MDRNELHITALDEKHYADVGTEYFATVEPMYKASKGEEADAVDPATGQPIAADPAAAVDPAATDPTATADPMATGDPAAAGTGEALAGPGFVVQLTGYHYHNADMANQTLRFLRGTLFKALEEGTVELPDDYDEETKKLTGEMIDVPIKDLGVSRVWLVQDKPLLTEQIDPEAHLMAEGGTTSATGFAQALGVDQPPAAGAEGAATNPDGTPIDPVAARMIEVKKYEFVVQFVWQPKTRTERRAIAEAREAAETAAAEAERSLRTRRRTAKRRFSRSGFESSKLSLLYRKAVRSFSPGLVARGDLPWDVGQSRTNPERVSPR
ncbi:MAG: hypothetical protein H0T51_06635 [Pirellulales bacterium]|nr:hypothetical protein [Pirellulales bacterium]